MKGYLRTIKVWLVTGLITSLLIGQAYSQNNDHSNINLDGLADDNPVQNKEEKEGPRYLFLEKNGLTAMSQDQMNYNLKEIEFWRNVMIYGYPFIGFCIIFCCCKIYETPQKIDQNQAQSFYRPPQNQQLPPQNMFPNQQQTVNPPNHPLNQQNMYTPNPVIHPPSRPSQIPQFNNNPPMPNQVTTEDQRRYTQPIINPMTNNFQPPTPYQAQPVNYQNNVIGSQQIHYNNPNFANTYNMAAQQPPQPYGVNNNMQQQYPNNTMYTGQQMYQASQNPPIYAQPESKPFGYKGPM